MGEGGGLMSPPISVQVCTVVLSYGGWVRCIWIMYTRRRSVEVLQVTGSLVLQILLWCLVLVCFCSCQTDMTVTKSLPVLSCRPVHYTWYRRKTSWLCMVTVYVTSSTMASGDAGGSRPVLTVVGSVFPASCRHCPGLTWIGVIGSGQVGHLCRPGRPGPEGVLRSADTAQVLPGLESPGVVKLDTSVVPDVLGLRAFYDDAESVWVLPGRAQNSVRVLVPDARVQAQGFHDMKLQDMTNVTGPAVSTVEMCDLRPQSLLSDITRQ